MENSQWISIKQELPPAEMEVLVYDGFSIYITCRLDEDSIVWDESACMFDSITHWMYLPSPPNNKGIIWKK